MATDKRILRTIGRRTGNTGCVNLPRHYMKRLGWNIGDAVSIEIVDGALVVVRVPIPSTDVLRSLQRQQPVEV